VTPAATATRRIMTEGGSSSDAAPRPMVQGAPQRVVATLTSLDAPTVLSAPPTG
jgi:hypothetical protein